MAQLDLGKVTGATWLSGAVDPTTEGLDGDFYLNTVSYDVFKKVSGAWGTAILNIKGATGETGTAGVDGAGVPIGGTAGQVLSKIDGTDHNTQWSDLPIHTKAFAFYIDDVLEVDTDLISIISPMALTITEIRCAVSVAPTGANLIIDVNKNGSTLYTTQGNRPTIAASGTSVTATDPDVTALAVGDILSIDIDQIGSTVAGANLSVIVICEV